MENHPIPQDITGFKFKLVGKMTVKQFAYVASGVLLAWLVYFVLKIPLFLSLPLAIVFAGGGTALAFLPIDGRPMDTMIANFLKALVAPTQFIYDKEGGNLSQVKISQTSTPAAAPQQPVAATIPTPEPATHAQSQSLNSSVINAFSQPTQAPAPTIEPIVASVAPNPPLPQQTPDQIQEEEKKVELEVDDLQEQLTQAQSQPQDPQANQTDAREKAAQLEKMLQDAARQKEQLEQELLSLKQQLNEQKQPEVASSPVPQPIEPPTEPAVAQEPVPQAQTAGAEGIPGLPDEPNLIRGIIKDPRGNPIPNILVEVKDAEDNPVRAFKTNGLGEFASATSLANGTYIVAPEDPKLVHKFDTVSIQATGAPLVPLEIISIDPREELRRELFN